MRWNIATGSAAAIGIALLGLLAGQFTKPAEPFNFDDFERAKRAQQPLIDRVRRAEAAPAQTPGVMKAGDLESGIKGSIAGYGVQGAVRP